MRSRSKSEARRLGEGENDSSGDEDAKASHARDHKKYFKKAGEKGKKDGPKRDKEGAAKKGKQSAKPKETRAQNDQQQERRVEFSLKPLVEGEQREGGIQDEETRTLRRVESYEAPLLSSQERFAERLDEHEEKRNDRDSESSEEKGPVKLSFFQALFTSLNYNLGLAVLCFPFQVERIGWSAYLTLVFVCLVCWATAWMIGKIMDRFPDIHSYADIANHTVRQLWPDAESQAHLASTTLRGFQIVELYFYIVYNLVTVHQAFSALGGMADETQWILTAVLCVPAVFVHNLAVLSKVSLVGIASFFALSLVMIVSSAEKLVREGEPAQPPSDWPVVPHAFDEWCKAYGPVLLLFAGHAVYPSIHHNLENKADYMRVVNWTFAAVFAFLVLLGMLCVTAFGPNIVELPTGYLEPHTLVSTFAQILMILKGITAYPVIAYPIVTEISSRFVVETTRNLLATPGLAASAFTPVLDEYAHLLEDDEEADGEEHAIPIYYSPFTPSALEQVQKKDPNRKFAFNMYLIQVTVASVVLAFSFSMSVVVPSLEFVMTLVGSVFAVSLAVTLPSLFFASLFRDIHAAAWPLLLCLFGVASMCISFTSLF